MARLKPRDTIAPLNAALDNSVSCSIRRETLPDLSDMGDNRSGLIYGISPLL